MNKWFRSLIKNIKSKYDYYTSKHLYVFGSLNDALNYAYENKIKAIIHIPSGKYKETIPTRKNIIIRSFEKVFK